MLLTLFLYDWTEYDRLDQLLGGHGWASGEVSEICAPSGTGKTHLCLNTLVLMLMHNRTSQAIWIDTLDGGFSAQHASDIVRFHIQQQQQVDENESYDDESSVEVGFVEPIPLGRSMVVCQ